jgi:hypothetical protein
MAAFSQEMLQPRRLVDAHTAGMLPRASVDFDCRYYPASNPKLGAGLNVGLGVGITDRLMIGIGYGGEGLIGRGRKAVFNYFPGLLFKYRLFEESYGGPGLAIGYDHQGYGGLTDTSEFDYKGYIYQSPGFFIALSKNFKLLNQVLFGLHTTVSYSMEDVRNVKWPNLFVGTDFTLNEELALVFEYNFGFNTRDYHGQHPVNYALINEGYLNCGLRWAFSPQFFVELDAKDVLENRYKKNGKQVGWTRELKLVYFFSFLKE